MELIQYSGLNGAWKVGVLATTSHESTPKINSQEMRMTHFTIGRSTRGFTAVTSKSFTGIGRRKSTIQKQPGAALAVEGSGVDERQNSVNSKSHDSIQNTKSTGQKSPSRVVHAMDYIQYLPELLKDDAGPPRWFSPVLTTKPIENAPLLLFLPEIVGTGLGFAMQQERLARLFELRCLHVPLMDRTPFEGLVSFVEKIVREEARTTPARPIYLLGESFGGALALAVAARNPALDLVLILVNPTTSFDKSPLQPLLPVIQALPSALTPAVPLLLGLLNYDPVQLASQFTANIASPLGRGDISPGNVTGVLQSLLEVVNTLPKTTLPWKLKMLQSSARYVNSRLRAVRAEVLVLASVKDQLLPSLGEAKRLNGMLRNCTYRQYAQSGHMLLMEEEFDLASVIKGANYYRRTRRKDVVSNFVRPTREEIDRYYGKFDFLRKLVSPVFFSTGADGKVVPGISMIPTSDKPLIFVGNHFFYGLDMGIVWGELVNKLDILPRGLAHPILFDKTLLEENSESVEGDRARLFGAVPVSGKNMFKILSRGESIALYPGGAREALHRKGEWHQIFWPERPELVRMAAKFGATFIPMCAVGEDDIYEILLDYDDLVSLPLVGDQIFEAFDKLPKWRDELDEEVGNQTLHTPVVMPKLGGPGRLYILFGKPIYTEGKKEYFRDPENVEAEYQRLKAEVEDGLAYLVKKREEDPYRQFLPRMAYELGSGGTKQAPTFTP